MFKNQKGNAWVGIVVVLVIVGVIAFTWWSVSTSEKRSSELLKPLDNSKTDTKTE